MSTQAEEPDREKLCDDWRGLGEAVDLVDLKLGANYPLDGPVEPGAAMTLRDMIAWIAGLSMGLASRCGVKVAEAWVMKSDEAKEIVDRYEAGRREAMNDADQPKTLG